MITIRPSVFCFVGRVAQDLYATVPLAVRRRLGTVPDVFAFLSVTEAGVDLKLGTRRPKLPPSEGSLQNRFWNGITYSTAAIGNIRVRTDALRRPAEASSSFQVVRGGPDIYLVQCLSDPLGWEMVFAVAEKIHQRNEVPPSAGRARGIFPLFHFPSTVEDAERDQALDGLRRLERLVGTGVLFPSLVLDRVNRNGYPLERWEDLVELLSDFIALGSSSEAAPDIWRVFPQVADLHGSAQPSDDVGSPGLSSLGLARFRFNKELLAEELTRFHLRDLKRALARTFPADPGKPNAEESRALLARLIERGLSARSDGTELVQREIVDWVRSANPARAPGLGAWAAALDRLQKGLFEMLGDVAQRIENARQESEALTMESPVRDTWIARLSVRLPKHYFYVPLTLAGVLAGSFVGLLLSSGPTKGFLLGGAIGGTAGLCIYWFFRERWTKETFTLGEFPQSSFTEGFSVPRTLERFSRKQRPTRRRSGIGIQLWGELRNQLEPAVKERIDAALTEIQVRLAAARKEEAELIFLDRSVNALRECVEVWKKRLEEVEICEPGRGFSGDIFPSDGPRRIYDWLRGRESAEAAMPALLVRVDPSLGPSSLLDLCDENSGGWGKERAEVLELRQVLEVLDDRPEDLVDRLTEASAPLWPRPGDGDELLRCFGEDFAWLAEATDLRSSIKDETIFIRILGRVKSVELART